MQHPMTDNKDTLDSSFRGQLTGLIKRRWFSVALLFAYLVILFGHLFFSLKFYRLPKHNLSGEGYELGTFFLLFCFAIYCLIVFILMQTKSKVDRQDFEKIFIFIIACFLIRALLGYIVHKAIQS